MWMKVISNGITQSGNMSWSLVLNEYQDGKTKSWRVGREMYDALGVSPTLTYDQAKIQVKALRDKQKYDRTLNRKAATINRIEHERLLVSRFLPEYDILCFEKQVLAPKYMGSDILDTTNKVYIRWRAAMKVMVAVALDPSDYSDRYYVVYNHLLEKAYSPDYCDRIIGLMNEYGYFYCKRYHKPFLPMSKLTKRNRQKQAEVNRKASPSKKSARITPQMLEAVKGQMKREQYLWMRASIWFGLRPEEVDLLNDRDSDYTYRVSYQGSTPILHVYQPKLGMIDEHLRWKMIPLFRKEQRETFKIIQGETLKRPLVKTLRALMNSKVGVYGGRKGFTDLMRGYDQDLENIAQWMGHQSVDRTFKDYKDKQVVHFNR